MGHGASHHVERDSEIKVHEAVPILQSGIFNGSVGNYSGSIHQYIYTAKSVNNAGYDPLDITIPGQIPRKGGCPSTLGVQFP